MKGLHLAEEFEDPGVSAGKPLASRPAGSKLLAAARKGKAVVVVAKLDRLFRSVADAASVIDDFDKRGIQLVAIAESFDMTSPYGRAMEKAWISPPNQTAAPETPPGRMQKLGAFRQQISQKHALAKMVTLVLGDVADGPAVGDAAPSMPLNREVQVVR